MFIDANEIIKLIEVCKDVKSKMEEESHMIHVDDIAATLQNLIDDEGARLDKMAKDFEDEEYGRLVMEESAIEKIATEIGLPSKIEWQDWPGGI